MVIGIFNNSESGFIEEQSGGYESSSLYQTPVTVLVLTVFVSESLNCKHVGYSFQFSTAIVL
jgi:hypothetical protein